ncbi:MAG: hypothetical protein ABFD82_16350 [Syntrophaceae bacterium]
MGKIYNSKCWWFISIFLFVLMNAINGHSAGFIAEWKPFKAKQELGLYAVDVSLDRILFSNDNYLKMDNGIEHGIDTVDKKDDSSWNVLKFHSVSISFSHAVIEQKQIDMNQKSKDGFNKADAIKSLPTTFLDAPYGNTIESIGKIFEPQVNLRIEF